MTELKRVKFELCSPGKYSEAEYAIFEDNCVVCDARDCETPAVNSYLEDVIEAVNKHEQLNRLGEPALQFYELQVRKHNKPGHFVFMLVHSNESWHPNMRFSWNHVKCPPFVVKAFQNIIGQPSVQVVDGGWQTYDNYEQERSIPPENKVEYDFLQGTGIEARRRNDEDEESLMLFGLLGAKAGTWRLFLGVSECDVPTTPGQKQGEFRRKVVNYAREMEALENRYKKFVNYRPN